MAKKKKNLWKLGFKITNYGTIYPLLAHCVIFKWKFDSNSKIYWRYCKNYKIWQCMPIFLNSNTVFLNKKNFLWYIIILKYIFNITKLIQFFFEFTCFVTKIHCEPENLKKSRPKKLVQSNKSISRKKISDNIPYQLFYKLAEISLNFFILCALIAKFQ